MSVYAAGFKMIHAWAGQHAYVAGARAGLESCNTLHTSTVYTYILQGTHLAQLPQQRLVLDYDAGLENCQLCISRQESTSQTSGKLHQRDFNITHHTCPLPVECADRVGHSYTTACQQTKADTQFVQQPHHTSSNNTIHITPRHDATNLQKQLPASAAHIIICWHVNRAADRDLTCGGCLAPAFSANATADSGSMIPTPQPACRLLPRKEHPARTALQGESGQLAGQQALTAPATTQPATAKLHNSPPGLHIASHVLPLPSKDTKGLPGASSTIPPT
jgi:hypothetical protein